MSVEDLKPQLGVPFLKERCKVKGIQVWGTVTVMKFPGPVFSMQLISIVVFLVLKSYEGINVE